MQLSNATTAATVPNATLGLQKQLPEIIAIFAFVQTLLLYGGGIKPSM